MIIFSGIKSEKFTKTFSCVNYPRKSDNLNLSRGAKSFWMKKNEEWKVSLCWGKLISLNFTSFIYTIKRKKFQFQLESIWAKKKEQLKRKVSVSTSAFWLGSQYSLFTSWRERQLSSQLDCVHMWRNLDGLFVKFLHFYSRLDLNTICASMKIFDMCRECRGYDVLFSETNEWAKYNCSTRRKAATETH